LGELATHVDEFKARGIQVIGLLAQSRDAVRRYIEDTGLPFDVLIDERRDVVRAYGVWHRIGVDAWNIARPAAFLIDTDQTILASWIGDHQGQFPTAADMLGRV
jgi:peroxiredoxin